MEKMDRQHSFFSLLFIGPSAPRDATIIFSIEIIPLLHTELLFRRERASTGNSYLSP